MNPALELVRAGAGSGKTTDLCQVVAEAVDAGMDPSRLLATTFTRKAAAELKARIQAKLLARSGDRRRHARDAERLELAAIGTVHSVAHQILSRYAVEMGLSPRLEVMEEAAEARTLGTLLGSLPGECWGALERLAHRLGIREEAVKEWLLALLSAKRSNRIGDKAFATQMEAGAERVCELLADGAALRDEPEDRLATLVRDALEQLVALKDDTQKVTDQARQKLKRLASGSVPFWGAHVEAMKLKAGRRSGADDCLNALRNHAAEVCLQVGLHRDIREFTRIIADVAGALENAYATHKRERGLLDFTDLELLFLNLLEHPVLGAGVASDYDLVLVDEFQDTNPLQLAIFQKLRQGVARNRWVGDPKQAIYGFRGTDPQLVNDVWNHAPGASRRDLPRNYRSQKGLVQCVGRLFEPVLGADARQTPHHPGEPKGLERWCLETRNKDGDAQAVACGIAQLGSEGMRWADIAVLVRTNKALGRMADALAALGIPSLMEVPGLLSTREGALALAGLRLVADRSDALAAATVMHLLEGNPQGDLPQWILDRLRAQRTRPEEERRQSRPWDGHEQLLRLERIPQALLSPSQVLQEVIEGLDLPARIAGWSDPARRSAHLDSLLRHGREYEDLATSGGTAPTLCGLILHLERLEAEGQDVCHPPLGHDAVTLATYHGAKGLEWPVVVLTDLNDARDPDLWSPTVTGGGHGLQDPLEGRTLRAWVWPFGVSDGEFAKPREGTGLEDRALASEEGQARVDAEAREALRLLYVGCTRAKRKLVFATRTGDAAWLDRLPTAKTLLDPSLPAGEHALADIDTTLVVRHLDADMMETHRREATGRCRWMKSALGGTRLEGDIAEPRFHSPSAAAPLEASPAGDLEELAGAGLFPTGAGEDQYVAIGEAVHAYLAAVPTLLRLDRPAKTAVAERCLAAFDVPGRLPASALVAAGERFRDWVQQRYPGATWQPEVPGSGPRSAGGRWWGTMDLLLRLPDGGVVLIDHKSAPLRREQCRARAQQYAGQLAAYRELLSAHGEQIHAMWIHFPLAGAVVRM